MSSELIDLLREHAALDKHSIYAAEAMRNAADELECYEGMKEGVAVRIADLEADNGEWLAEIARLREAMLATALYAEMTNQERGPDTRMTAIANTLRDALKG